MCDPPAGKKPKRSVTSRLPWLGLVSGRRRPLNYDPPVAGPTRRPTEEPVDIIVPVHGAAAAVRRCFSSVLTHTDLNRHRLVVVVDGDNESRRENLLDPLLTQKEANIAWLENPVCLGFAASVNRGMQQSQQDVVLLNSDTQVTRGWVEKLQAAAKSAAEIATVTPFSNHATICSVPRALVLNAVPPGYDIDTFGRLVEEVAERAYPRLPTGVGMCLYIKRRALTRLGLFDVERFGVGYGEETDFCFRALEAGFIHVLDDATFIFHEGERSFGGRRAKRIRGAERTLRRLHPAYVPTLAHFLDRDPLHGARERIRSALVARGGFAGSTRVGKASTQASVANAGRATRPRKVVHLVHGWPPYSHGGTEHYAYWLASEQKTDRAVAVLARIADPERQLGDATEVFDAGLRIRLVVNNFQQRNPLARNALREPLLEADFARFLDEECPDLVHVHHLAGHGLSMMRVLASRNLPIVYQVQDWWALCARANLMQPDVGLCSGPSPAKCSACLPLTRLPPAPLWNRALYQLRSASARRSLKLADAFVMGSQAIADDYRRAGLLPASNENVHILPYGVAIPSLGAPPLRTASNHLLRVGYVGTLMPHKGVHVAVEAFDGMDPARATLVVWGDLEASPDYAAELQKAADPRVVRFAGRFEESAKAEVYGGLDVLLVPSLGLESYGLVAREAMAHGVPVIASRRSALIEIFDGDPPGGGGATFEPGDVSALRRLLKQLIDDPETVSRWRREIPRVVSLQEHAAAIDRVYAETLARRSLIRGSSALREAAS